MRGPFDRPWDSQPQGAVSEDINNSLTSGLLWLAAPRNAQARLAVQAESNTGTISRGPKWFGRHGGGIAWGIDAASSSVNLGGAAQTTTGSITVLVLALHTATGRGDYLTRWANGGTNAASDQFNLLTGLTASKPQFYVSSGAVTANSGASSIAITQTQPHVIVGSYGSGGNVKVYVDGALGASASGGGILMSLTCTQNLRVGDANTAGTAITGWVGLVAMWDRQLSDGEVAEVSRDPWQLFEPQRIYIPAAAASGSSGTLATTNANDTSAAAGSVGGAVSGSLARTNANDSLTAEGTTVVLGTLARTNAADAVAATGSTTIVGSLATSNANDTCAAAGSVSGVVSGTLAHTNADDAAAASGTTEVTGAASTTNGNDIATASGSAGSVPVGITGAGRGSGRVIGRRIAIESHGRMLYFEDEKEAQDWLDEQAPKQAKAIRKLARKVARNAAVQDGAQNLLAQPVFQAPQVVSGPEPLLALAKLRASVLQGQYNDEIRRQIELERIERDDEEMAAVVLLMMME